MFCSNCGKENVEGTKFCNECGAPMEAEVNEAVEVVDNADVPQGTASAGWIWLGIFEPIIAMVLFFIMRNKYPSVGIRLKKGFIIGFILLPVIVVFSIFICVAILALAGMTAA